MAGSTVCLGSVAVQMQIPTNVSTASVGHIVERKLAKPPQNRLNTHVLSKREKIEARCTRRGIYRKRERERERDRGFRYPDRKTFLHRASFLEGGSGEAGRVRLSSSCIKNDSDVRLRGKLGVSSNRVTGLGGASFSCHSSGPGETSSLATPISGASHRRKNFFPLEEARAPSHFVHRPNRHRFFSRI